MGFAKKGISIIPADLVLSDLVPADLEEKKIFATDDDVEVIFAKPFEEIFARTLPG